MPSPENRTAEFDPAEIDTPVDEEAPPTAHFPTSAPPPEALVGAAQAGNKSALTALYARFQPLVRRLVRRYAYLTRFDLREELQGEIYVDFVRLVREYDPSGRVSFAHYLDRKLPGLVHNFVRAQAREHEHEASLYQVEGPEETEEPWLVHLRSHPVLASVRDEIPDTVALHEVLSAALVQLTPRQARAFWMREVERREMSEIAAALEAKPERPV